ncbi:serine protease [Staphylococcus sp. 17KM0847]|uniref:trypsin-like serine peptidase n=1 Tax=Staphylococcus sp. 17KM0847 TaxID=2583989 RepID=UPI0015DCC162|nr:serine protease [Staphylococcus sp. 17KM0847]QLK86649.1 trypsin-like peptidase domain-containing protein [Staphylococcus sp. 17KM0847]
MIKFTKFFSVFLFVFIISLIFSITLNAESYLNRTVNERNAGIMEAQELVQQINNNELSFTRLDKINTNISGVGILSNTKNKVYGTAFVIDDYTILTNNHVVEKRFGIVNKAIYEPESPSNLKFMPSRDANNIPYSFTIKDIKMIRGVDVAVVHTNEKLTNKVTPLKIANEKNIKDMKLGDKITTYGYPSKEYLDSDFINDPRYKMYKSEGFYLLKVNSDDPQFYSKMIIRRGNSGSPILNVNNEVVGINSGGMNNTNANATVRAKNELAYVFSFTDYVRKEILDNSY